MPAAALGFAALAPASFLERSALVFADQTAIIDGDRRFTYVEFADRAARLAGALSARGVRPGDRVAALCSNSHVMLELHQAVPAMGAVLVPLNTRLAAAEHAYVVDHSRPRLIVATNELAERARSLAGALGIGVLIEDDAVDSYEQALAEAHPEPWPDVDERALMAINYTSGTTGRPKGVMYHHRGAYLQAVAMAYHARLDHRSRYLWILPMFHCNGWCFTWAVTAAGGVHVCLRSVDAPEIWRLLDHEGVTHFSAAPTVLSMIADSDRSRPLERSVHVDTGGAPPSPTLLGRLESLGMRVTHLYGLTETFGPIAVNQWKAAWDDEPPDRAAWLQARQGVQNIVARPLRVIDRATGLDVPADGTTMGELAVTGNDVMLGYYRDESATAAATLDGYFLTGDLAVTHEDGYVEIKDRGKDVIISGGENIASVEVEKALDTHPAVAESAVVGRSDAKWGEVPVAYVTLRAGHHVTEEELRAHVRGLIASFKVPKAVYFGVLPKTSTGKIQKHVLRRQPGDEAPVELE